MIKFLFKWLKTQILVNLRSPRFYLSVLLLILGFSLIDGVISEYNEDTLVLLYSDDNEISSECVSILMSDGPDGFSFLQVDNKEELKRKVSIGEAPCGVIFNLSEDLPNKSAIEIYQTAGTVDGYVVREIIYPVLEQAKADGWLADYLKGLEWDDNWNKEAIDETVDNITHTYETVLGNMGICIYEVNQTGSDKDSGLQTHIDNTKKEYYSLLIVLILGIGLVDVCLSDKAFYKMFEKKIRALLYVETIIITIVMSTLSAAVIRGLLIFIYERV